MSDLKFHHFSIILIIIGFYFTFNYLLSLYNFNVFELFEFFDLCSLKNKEHDKKKNNKSNITSQIKKNIIVGYNKDNTPIEEEILVNQYCNLEDEMCLVDPKGNNTCCDGLKCIRKENNYQYKVCSNKNEEDYSCGYNKFTCNLQLFDQLFEKNWNAFIDKFNFNKKYSSKDYYDKMKSNIKKKINGLCGSQNVSEKEQNNIINVNLNNIFNEGLVFAQPVGSIKFD
jgi:hypothetical protein